MNDEQNAYVSEGGYMFVPERKAVIKKHNNITYTRQISSIRDIIKSRIFSVRCLLSITNDCGFSLFHLVPRDMHIYSLKFKDVRKNNDLFFYKVYFYSVLMDIQCKFPQFSYIIDRMETVSTYRAVYGDYDRIFKDVTGIDPIWFGLVVSLEAKIHNTTDKIIPLSLIRSIMNDSIHAYIANNQLPNKRKNAIVETAKKIGEPARCKSISEFIKQSDNNNNDCEQCTLNTLNYDVKGTLEKIRSGELHYSDIIQCNSNTHDSSDDNVYNSLLPTDDCETKMESETINTTMDKDNTMGEVTDITTDNINTENVNTDNITDNVTTDITADITTDNAISDNTLGEGSEVSNNKRSMSVSPTVMDPKDPKRLSKEFVKEIVSKIKRYDQKALASNKLRMSVKRHKPINRNRGAMNRYTMAKIKDTINQYKNQPKRNETEDMKRTLEEQMNINRHLYECVNFLMEEMSSIKNSMCQYPPICQTMQCQTSTQCIPQDVPYNMADPLCCHSCNMMCNPPYNPQCNTINMNCNSYCNTICNMDTPYNMQLGCAVPYSQCNMAYNTQETTICNTPCNTYSNVLPVHTDCINNSGTNQLERGARATDTKDQKDNINKNPN